MAMLPHNQFGSGQPLQKSTCFGVMHDLLLMFGLVIILLDNVEEDHTSFVPGYNPGKRLRYQFLVSDDNMNFGTEALQKTLKLHTNIVKTQQNATSCSFSLFSIGPHDAHIHKQLTTRDNISMNGTQAFVTCGVQQNIEKQSENNFVCTEAIPHLGS